MPCVAHGIACLSTMTLMSELYQGGSLHDQNCLKKSCPISDNQQTGGSACGTSDATEKWCDGISEGLFTIYDMRFALLS